MEEIPSFIPQSKLYDEIVIHTPTIGDLVESKHIEILEKAFPVESLARATYIHCIEIDCANIHSNSRDIGEVT